MSLTKSDIISAISNHLGLSKAKSIQVTETLLEIIKQTLAKGEDVLIIGKETCTHQELRMLST